MRTPMTHVRSAFAALLLVLAATGCGDPAPGPGDAVPDAGSTENVDPAGLEIVELTVSSDVLTEGEDVLVRAVLRDPEGLDDLVSTFVIDEDDTILTSVGATLEFGVYEAKLTWQMFNPTERPLNFVGSEQHTLRLRVTDGVGNTDQKSISLRLSCGDGSPAHAACDGTCVNLHEDRENCGACGNACGGKDPGHAGCVQGVCHAPAECSALATTRTCKDECASKGKTCANVCFDRNFREYGALTSGSKDYCTYSGWWYLTNFKTCEEPSGGGYVRCCCSE